MHNKNLPYNCLSHYTAESEKKKAPIPHIFRSPLTSAFPAIQIRTQFTPPGGTPKRASLFPPPDTNFSPFYIQNFQKFMEIIVDITPPLC
jgi:hypothetical protein